MILGVDVSHWQGKVSWDKVKAEGVKFAFAKATESDNFTDPQFSVNISGMRKNGIVPGAYHFLRPGNVTGQAERFIRIAPPDVMHALDVEAAGLNVEGWVKRYRQSYPDKTLLIYTGRDLWRRAGGGHGPDYGPLWAAGYIPNRYLGSGSLATVSAKIGTNRGGVPFSGWTAPTFLQFTASAIVPGVSGPCDGNVFYGTLEQLTALTPSSGVIDMPLNTNDIKNIWTGNAADLIAHNQVADPKKPTDPKNPTWKPSSVLEETNRVVRALAAGQAAQGAQLAALTTAVTALSSNSATGIQEAFAAGVKELQDQLDKIQIDITTDGA